MAALTIEADARTLLLLERIAGALEGVKARLDALAKEQAPESEWLTAAEFKRKYKIGQSTLYRWAEAGQVEKRNFGEKSPRYRMKEDAHEEASELVKA